MDRYSTPVDAATLEQSIWDMRECLHTVLSPWATPFGAYDATSLFWVQVYDRQHPGYLLH